MPLVPVSSLTLATLALAGVFGLSGDAPRQPQSAAVLYCSGCLCDTDRPDMAAPGRWVASGRLAGHVTLRFRPDDPALASASSCRTATRG